MSSASARPWPAAHNLGPAAPGLLPALPGLLLGLELAHVQLYLEEVTTHLISPDQQRLQRSICALPPLACSLPTPGLGLKK